MDKLLDAAYRATTFVADTITGSGLNSGMLDDELRD